MSYAILEYNGHIRDWVRLPNEKRKDFADENLANRWIKLHGNTELRYEVVEVNMKLPKKRKSKGKGKKRTTWYRIERSYSL